MRWPSEKQILEILNSVSEDDWVAILPDDASEVEKIKFELCSKFVIYIRDKNISQAELARFLEIDRSRVNWIIKYKIEHFTIDRLYELVQKLNVNVHLKVS